MLGEIAATSSPDVLFQIHRCPWFLFVHLALEISSEDEVLRLGALVPMNIEVQKKYLLSQDRIVVFEIRLHSKSPMLYRPALHGNSNALSFARRALKDKSPTPTVPLKTVLPNRQVFMSDPVNFADVSRDILYLSSHCRSVKPFKPRIKSHLLFAGTISSRISPR
jgi:hypothetical protein